MPETVTTLPISPTTFWFVFGLVCLIGITAAIYWLLNVSTRAYSPPIWEEVPGGWHPVVILLGLLWVGLFGLTIAAAYAGVWQMFDAPGAGASPGLGMGALLAALLGGPFLIWGTVLKHRTVGFQKEGHLTDRINKAVEMLGAEKTVKRHLESSAGKRVFEHSADDKPDFSKPVYVEETAPNIEVRIGAILSLERIAQDSTAYDKGRDHVRVMEILCAYVRQNVPTESLRPTSTPFPTKKPRIDVQYILTILGRRSNQQRDIEMAEKYRLDLSSSDLDGANLSKMNFSAASFRGSRLERANLSYSNFTGALFCDALLDYAKFDQSQLYGTNLDGATFGGANRFGLEGANLHGVSIEGANFSSFDFSNETYDHFFGSRDTNIGFYYQHAKNAGLDIAEEIYRRSDQTLSLDLGEFEKDVPEVQKYFLHWNPDYRDVDNPSEFRRFYRKRKKLVGWPFED